MWYGQGASRIKKVSVHPIEARRCPLSKPSQTVSVREWVVKTATTRHIIDLDVTGRVAWAVPRTHPTLHSTMVLLP